MMEAVWLARDGGARLRVAEVQRRWDATYDLAGSKGEVYQVQANAPGVFRHRVFSNGNFKWKYA